VIVVIHVLLVGTHFADPSGIIPRVCAFLLGGLLFLEAWRLDRWLRRPNRQPATVGWAMVVFALLIGYGFAAVIGSRGETFGVHHGHTHSGPSASQFAIDGTISAFLHIDADAQPVTMSWKFTQTKPTFHISDCECRASFLKSGRLVQQTALGWGAEPNEAEVAVKLPAGRYEIDVTGRPLTSSAFIPFTLRYAVEILPEKSSLQDATWFHWVHYGLIYGTIIIAGLVTWIRSRKPSLTLK